MNKDKLVWITFNAFLDTDLYIVKELLAIYSIDWYIVKSRNDNIDFRTEIEEIAQNDSIKMEIIECGRRLRYPECIKVYFNLFQCINKTNAEVIYTTLAGAPYFIPMVILCLNTKKVVLAIHNVHVPKGGTAAKFFKFYNWIAYKGFKNFQTFSVSQCEQLKQIVPNKNVYKASFILKDFGKASRARIDDRISFLNFGNMREYKRLDVLIEAAQKAYEETQVPFKVILAGKCDNWEKYHSLIKYDFLFDIRLGRVNNDEIPNLFQESDYFVAPYQDIAQSGSAIVAINYEKPIIASKLPAFEEYIEEGINGFLISPADTESLAKVIINVLKHHHEIYNELVKNIRKSRAEMFSTNAVINEYKEIFDEVSGK